MKLPISASLVIVTIYFLNIYRMINSLRLHIFKVASCQQIAEKFMIVNVDQSIRVKILAVDQRESKIKIATFFSVKL